MKSSTTFPFPASADCPEYYFRYINLLPEVDIVTYLHTQRDWFGDWIENLTPGQALYRYAAGKWSLAEMIGHVLDTERVFAYRMMAISRADENKLPGFDQDTYVLHSIYDTIPPADLAAEWKAVRSATLYLMRSINADMAARTGIANQLPIKAFAFPYMMAGHVLHHYNMARERYLGE